MQVTITHYRASFPGDAENFVVTLPDGTFFTGESEEQAIERAEKGYFPNE